MNTLLQETQTQYMPPLEALLISDQEKPEDQFNIDNNEKAAWAARKILTAEERISNLSDQAKQYKNQINSWYQKTIQGELDSIDYLKNIIRPYVEEEIEKLHKSKTLNLPGLNIQLRKKPDKIEITDKDIAISFCEANHPDAVIIKKEISKSYLKDLLTNKGEIIPGSHMVPGESELYIKDK